MTPQEYEKICAQVAEKLGQDHAVQILGYGPNCKVVGDDGVARQFDVLMRTFNGTHYITTAFECKHWTPGRPVDIEVVDSIAGKIGGHRIDKVGIFSSSGFTSGAIKAAKHRNISLLEVREMMTDDDWKGLLREIHIELQINVLHCEFLGFINPHDAFGPDGRIAPGTTITVTELLEDITVKQPGLPPKSLHQIVNHEGPTDDGEHEVRFAPNTKMTLESEQITIAIDGVRLKVWHETLPAGIGVFGSEGSHSLVKDALDDTVRAAVRMD